MFNPLPSTPLRALVDRRRVGISPHALCILLPALLWAGELSAADGPDYLREIKPLLALHCVECHGPRMQESELRLDTAAQAIAGGNLGPAVKPGDSAASLLVKVIEGKSDEVSRMPPEDDARPLTNEQIQLFRRWIDAGAKFPPGEVAQPPSRTTSEHWAFQPIRRAKRPKVKDADWPRNAIDAFVLAKLEAKGIQPSREADRRTLMRRAYLDLTGLPPTTEQVRGFLADKRPDSYERLVDRLLSSPAYGERWGRHWLDLARYADSDGYTNDVARVMWAYRDWVIDAFNAGMPFDQFTIEQFAGDLLPDAGPEQRIATGFHRNTQRNREGGSDPEQYRVEAVVDRVSTTGVVFLGLTLGCVRCHEHKSDPISHREFYELYAFLNNQDEPTLTVQLDRPESGELRETSAAIAGVNQQLAKLETSLAERQPAWERDVAQAQEQWSVVKPVALSSKNGSHLEMRADASVLVSSPANTDTFTIDIDVPSKRLSAIRLEVLTDDSLPGKGPGWASNGNFVLHEFELFSVAESRQVKRQIARTDADHAQPKFPSAHAVDGNGRTGWAINLAAGAGGSIHTDRTAMFALAEPLDDVDRVRIRIVQNDKSYLIGRFRFSMTAQPTALLGSLPTDVRAALEKPVDERNDKERSAIRGAFLARNADRAKLIAQRTRLQSREKQLRAKTTTTTLVMSERSAKRETYIHIRGDFLRKGKVVEPNVPKFLPPIGADKPTRLDFARWLVAADNPLTPRVTVNRIWQQFFGRGVVATENDLGAQGEPPTHPRLLDFLAAELIEQQWDLKRVQRLILTSSTYRQSSRRRPELSDVDPNNLLYARQNRLRLEAEAIRDSALAVSGLLSQKMKGPSVFPPQPAGVMAMTRNPNRKWVVSQGGDRFRRGMYTYFWRSTPHPFLKQFNAPESNTTCTRRDRSNTPLQALTLLNDEAFFESAFALAGRIARSSSSDDVSSRMSHAMELCLMRPPTNEELAILTRFYERERSAPADIEKFSQLYRRWLPASVSNAEALGLVAVARALLNTDEFITRE